MLPIYVDNTQRQAYSDAVLEDGPVAYWRLGDDLSTNTAVNLGSIGASSVDGTYSGGPIRAH
ncbi:MAG: hypothetical protein R3C05_00630 [Pirellulaceae bacterium]